MTTINTEVRNFFLDKVNKTSVSINDLKDLNINVDKKDFLEADKDNNGELDLEEIGNAGFYKQVLAVIEDKKGVDSPDEEKEKEEQESVSSKNNAGF